MSEQLPFPFIAEIKTQSPFGFKSPYPFAELMDVAIEHGDWISVHTNALWGGDFEAISFVRRATKKPILAKGLHSTDSDIKRALDHGADYVLVVDRIPSKPDYFDRCLFEIPLKLLRQFKTWDTYRPDLKFVSNARDLRTGGIKNQIDAYVSEEVWICQASNLKDPMDVHPMADAFIVGEHLMSFCQKVKNVGRS